MLNRFEIKGCNLFAWVIQPMGLLWWLSGKKIHLQWRSYRRLGVTPWVRKIPGGGDGSPLQYSCLENPMVRGAWWATVHGAAKCWTRLSDYTQHTQQSSLLPTLLSVLCRSVSKKSSWIIRHSQLLLRALWQMGKHALRPRTFKVFLLVQSAGGQGKVIWQSRHREM